MKFGHFSAFLMTSFPSHVTYENIFGLLETANNYLGLGKVSFHLVEYFRF